MKRTPEEEQLPPAPPPKKGNKLQRWLGTRTGKTVIGVVAAGTAAITSPAVQAAAETVLAGLNSGQKFGSGLVIAGILAGIARAGSA